MSIHRSTHDPLNQDQFYIMLASEIYGITIHIHTAHSERLYQTDDDCPVVHLVQFQSFDECCVYLPTEKQSIVQTNHKINTLTDESDDQETSNFVCIDI